MDRKIKCGRYTVTVTTENKILFPKAGITKGDLIRYYERIAPIMIPHLKNRPLMMHRFVHGITGEGFYQKDAPDYFPSWIAVAPIEKKEGGIVRYVLCNNAATLVYIANQLCITPHIWLSRVPKVDYPDRMIFDLDPSKGVSLSVIRWAAKKIKELLEKCGLTPFVMTTGSRGFHVVVSLKKIHTFDYTRTFARDLARLLVHRYPYKLTLEMRKDKRGKRIFVDTLRNAFAQTGVAPYGVRAKPGAPIATPIEWHELLKKGIKPQSYTIKNIFRRLSRKKDPWLSIDRAAVSLKQARKKLDILLQEEGLE
ncbi:MAG TPA: ATP-dependent DNA ligase [Candidatus Dependentiae bacterium]|nr:ATP-dependent DNA ligase [Candidatus Dependentiae bacterium]